MAMVCLEGIWKQNLTYKNWPTKCIEKYPSFLAPSTLAQYNNCIKKFHVFCEEKGIQLEHKFDNIDGVVVEFLNDIAEKSDRPESMLRTHMAALKHFLNGKGLQYESSELGNFVKALVKVETNRPAGRTKIMPIQNFMIMFEKWDENQNLQTDRLRQKAITLFALAAMCRPSDMAPAKGFFRDQIEFKNDGSLVVRFFSIKNDQDRHGMEVKIDPTNNIKTDPVSCLMQYCERTQGNMAKQPVFVTNDGIKGLTARAIADILGQSIKEAGLGNEFTPRSFRPTAATASVVGGVAPQTARTLGRWKSESVFFERYLYPTAKDSITQKMFSAKT